MGQVRARTDGGGKRTVTWAPSATDLAQPRAPTGDTSNDNRAAAAHASTPTKPVRPVGRPEGDKGKRSHHKKQPGIFYVKFSLLFFQYNI